MCLPLGFDLTNNISFLSNTLVSNLQTRLCWHSQSFHLALGVPVCSKHFTKFRYLKVIGRKIIILAGISMLPRNSCRLCPASCLYDDQTYFWTHKRPGDPQSWNPAIQNEKQFISDMQDLTRFVLYWSMMKCFHNYHKGAAPFWNRHDKQTCIRKEYIPQTKTDPGDHSLQRSEIYH